VKTSAPTLPSEAQENTPLFEAAGPAGFETGVLEFAGKLRSFVRKRVSDPTDAEDVTQDVLLKIFRSRRHLRDTGKLEAWIYQTARTTVIDYYRRRRPADELPPDLADSIAPRDEVAEKLRRSVRAFLATLPEIHREPLQLAEFQGRTAAEIAEQLGISLTAAKSRLARGRALLRRRLLECCRFETDRYGHVIDMHRRQQACACETEPLEPTCPTCAEEPTEVEINRARADDMSAILGLLRRENLPTGDLANRPTVHFIVARAGSGIAGCATIEPLGNLGLVRSVAVAPQWRGRGIGDRLVREVETLARSLNVTQLFLLTTTAGPFFERLGYTRVDRQFVPLAVRHTTEFASLCPASAIVMQRQIGAR